MVNTSAVMAILKGEPDAAVFDAVLRGNEGIMSVATRCELVQVVLGQFGAERVADLEPLLDAYGVTIEPVLAQDAALLEAASLRYGKGRAAEPACLNLGDLFAYALAKRTGLPLLFKGDDFRRTDIESALPSPAPTARP